MVVMLGDYNESLEDTKKAEASFLEARALIEVLIENFESIHELGSDCIHCEADQNQRRNTHEKDCIILEVEQWLTTNPVTICFNR